MTVPHSSGSISDETQPKRGPAEDESNAHDPKKPRLLQETASMSSSSSPLKPPAAACLASDRWLIQDCKDHPWANMPVSLCATTNKKIGHNLDRLRGLLDHHGFKTTQISSPRAAVSIYKESCQLTSKDALVRNGKEFLLLTFGLHPQQETIEHEYDAFGKNPYCLLFFCQKLGQAYGNRITQDKIKAKEDASERLFSQIDETLALAKNFRQGSCGSMSSRMVQEQVHTLIELATKVKGTRCYRKEEWTKEFQRIRASNSTLSNALVSVFQSCHDMCLQDVHLKYNPHQPKYDRMTMALYNPELDCGRCPGHFTFLPGLRTIQSLGPDPLVKEMIQFFWTVVIRNGYFATTRLQAQLESKLRAFFLGGITSNSSNHNLPVPLQANFVPTVPFSIYLYGKAGSGKSSFAKVIPQALQSTLETYVDPQCVARFVKQNLNKTIQTLELEFELRPNNNDMSIMSIIQGRRMAMSQSKPGLVVLNLEEMPMHSSESNPNQLSVSQLIRLRFGGRKGSYQQEQQQQSTNGRSKSAPRNSDKRSIGRDCSLVSIFTSNYELQDESKLALQQLPMYESLLPIEMKAITGSDRCQFAKSYLRQRLLDSLETCMALEISMESISLDIPPGNGDTRPLVRQLRMVAYYLGKLLKDTVSNTTEQSVNVKHIQLSQNETTCVLTIETQIGENPIQKREQHLTRGRLGNWFPTGAFDFDPRIQSAIQMVRNLVEDEQAIELAVILEFWCSTTLAPAVILSRDLSFIKRLMGAIESMGETIHSIRNVDASSYKMIKSLYDPKEMPNLRDDILKFGAGALVATELRCPTEDSQLCIREMIEDSPSMTAFSSTKSALCKSGLLFAIHVQGDVTPEILSRVSIII